MDIFKIKKQEFFMILLGVTILALGITWFLSPLGLVTGGLSGLAIVVQEMSSNVIQGGIPLYITTFILNIPLFLISVKQRGVGFAKKSMYAVVLLSVALWYTAIIPNPFQVGGDLLLAGIFGGVLVGVGVGLVLKTGATTGGTDMLAASMKFKFKNLPISKLMLFIDGAIIVSGFFIFGSINAMYAILSVLVTTKIISSVLEGGHAAKAAFIISDKPVEIANEIMEKLPRGSTGLKAKGMYSEKEKEMLFVVLSQKQLPELREIIKGIDPNAFITIADVREVLGEGFLEDYDSLII